LEIISVSGTTPVDELSAGVCFSVEEPSLKRSPAPSHHSRQFTDVYAVVLARCFTLKVVSVSAAAAVEKLQASIRGVVVKPARNGSSARTRKLWK